MGQQLVGQYAWRIDVDARIHVLVGLDNSVSMFRPKEHYLTGFPMQKRCLKPRRKTWPSLIAGEA